ncbi:MAG: hypothetical protein F4039_07335 [Gammaproteobacteria bacterium]|nr:hypothetical protein [Gammaproteobacteria bacterium]MYK43882.1 hypothetical protein [Gammaproteobacteria bacterium]
MNDQYETARQRDSIKHTLRSDSRFVIIERHNGLVVEYRVESNRCLSGVFMSLDQAQRHISDMIALKRARTNATA